MLSSYNLVPERDSILSQYRNLGLLSAGPFKSIRVDRGDMKPPHF